MTRWAWELGTLCTDDWNGVLKLQSISSNRTRPLRRRGPLILTGTEDVSHCVKQMVAQGFPSEWMITLSVPVIFNLHRKTVNAWGHTRKLLSAGWLKQMNVWETPELKCIKMWSWKKCENTNEEMRVSIVRKRVLKCGGRAAAYKFHCRWWRGRKEEKERHIRKTNRESLENLPEPPGQSMHHDNLSEGERYAFPSNQKCSLPGSVRPKFREDPRIHAVLAPDQQYD